MTQIARLISAMLACGALALAAGCQRAEPPAPAAEPAAPAPDATTTPAPDAAPATAPVAEDTPPEGALRAYVWRCDDGQTLNMRNLFREHAIAVDFHEGTQRLEHVVSASGARYANADESIVFWTKGSEATLERKGSAAVKCTERRFDSLREDARLRGVVYRAQGNEPGWVLEIGPGGRLDWTTNWGETRHSFENAAEAAAGNGRTFTATAADGTTIRATVTPEPCVDDGENTFDHTVVIESGDTTLRGCGTRLN